MIIREFPYPEVYTATVNSMIIAETPYPALLPSLNTQPPHLKEALAKNPQRAINRAPKPAKWPAHLVRNLVRRPNKDALSLWETGLRNPPLDRPPSHHSIRRLWHRTWGVAVSRGHLSPEGAILAGTPFIFYGTPIPSSI